MSSHYVGCQNPRFGAEACDLQGSREHMCQDCLTYLVRSERPSGWSPRVRRDVPLTSSEPPESAE